MKNGGMWCRDEVSGVCGCGGVDRGRYTAQRHRQSTGGLLAARSVSQTARLLDFTCLSASG